MNSSAANSPPSVQDGDVRGRRIPLAPPREQQRIASRIEELFSDIEAGERALERVQKLVERYRQSVLKAAVTGELTREWREKHKGLAGVRLKRCCNACSRSVGSRGSRLKLARLPARGRGRRPTIGCTSMSSPASRRSASKSLQRTVGQACQSNRRRWPSDPSHMACCSLAPTSTTEYASFASAMSSRWRRRHVELEAHLIQQLPPTTRARG